MRDPRFSTAVAGRFLAMGLVPLLVLGVFAGVRITRVTRDAVEAHHDLTAQTLRSETEAFLQAPATALRQFASIVPGSETAAEAASSAVRSLDFVESIVLVDDRGTVRTASVTPGVAVFEDDLLGIDRSRDPQYLVASTYSRTAWSGVFTSFVSGNRAVQVAVPIQRGVAMATVDIESLFTWLSGFQDDSDTQAVVLDTSGTVVFHSDGEMALLRPNWMDVAPVVSALEGSDAPRNYELDGESMVGSTSVVAGAGWVVLVQEPTYAAYTDVTSAWIAFVATGLAVSVAAMAVAAGFARSIADPVLAIGRQARSVASGEYTPPEANYRFSELRQLEADIAGMSRAVRDRERSLTESQERLSRANEDLERAFVDLVEAMGRAVEAKDPFTQGHQRRVSQLAESLASEMGLDARTTAAIRLTSMVHDVGKLGVPTEILVKPSALSDIEMELARQHSVLGYEMLKDIAFPYPVADIVLQHHERCDGSGYPQGLRREAIALEARVIAVADVVEAMSSHRPYRASLGIDAAVEEIVSNAHRYDPDVVAALRTLYAQGRIPL